jgi:predicted DNA binding CopG/RHH family protein
VPDIGGKERGFMKKETHYRNAPEGIGMDINSSNIIDDFLPPPELLIPKEETRKITITLSQKSIDFFKEVAERTNVPYQQMIRKVLDQYSNHYMK